ncbi:hypothetical protein GCM10023201_29620 [Actinomycetospora corticicola]
MVAVLDGDRGAVGQRARPGAEPPAESGGALEQFDVHPALREDGRGGHPREAAADHDDLPGPVVRNALGQVRAGSDHDVRREHAPEGRDPASDAPPLAVVALLPGALLVDDGTVAGRS